MWVKQTVDIAYLAKQIFTLSQKLVHSATECNMAIKYTKLMYQTVGKCKYDA